MAMIVGKFPISFSIFSILFSSILFFFSASNFFFYFFDKLGGKGWYLPNSYPEKCIAT